MALGAFLAWHFRHAPALLGSRDRTGLLLIPFAAFALIAWPSVGFATVSASGVEPFVGRYRHIGGEEEVRSVAEAIDNVVDEMNPFIRGLARRRLRGPNMPTKELRVFLVDGDIRITRTGQPEISAPASGDSVQWRNPNNGNEFQVRHRVTAQGVLEQILKGDRGTSRNHFVLAEDGRRLTIRTMVQSDRLPAPLRFETTYERISRSTPSQ